MASIYANVLEQNKGFTEGKSSTPTGLVWNTNLAAVLLFWNTNTAPNWPPRRHVKTLYRVIGLAPVAVKTFDSAILRINHNTADNYLGNSLGVVI